MTIRLMRRLTQCLFFILFITFSVVLNYGDKLWQLRGWPVNWILQLDPLVALSTVLATGQLYGGLLWAIPVILLTLLCGRVFCGWICPFGTIHQVTGWFGSLFVRRARLAERNKPHKLQALKYYILLAVLLFSLFSLMGFGSIQSGLLDPIPLATRSLNIIMIPFFESILHITLNANPRYYAGGVSIGIMLIVLIGINLWIPRFFCRFLCPTGALLGLLSKASIFRIVKKEFCRPCGLCEQHCEGACSPSDRIRFSECVMCCNCLVANCPNANLGYSHIAKLETEIQDMNVERRGALFVFGAAMVSASFPTVSRIGAKTDASDPLCVRPPGSLEEEEFLKRCVKCDQCIKICPSNCLVPADLKHGFEGLWTPVLDFRTGTSGCQLNCTACGHVCPTAAIRLISLEEKLGLGKFAENGPIRIGTAFVDRTRCLPWANNRPCIVCQENCPVTPKAIQIETMFRPCSDFVYQVSESTEGKITLCELLQLKFNLATGDYWLALAQNHSTRWRITSCDDVNYIEFDGKDILQAGTFVCLLVNLSAPVVNFNSCIGCGICEHECPVSGLRAIRVTSENESRNPNNSITPKGI